MFADVIVIVVIVVVVAIIVVAEIILMLIGHLSKHVVLRSVSDSILILADLLYVQHYTIYLK